MFGGLLADFGLGSTFRKLGVQYENVTPGKLAPGSLHGLWEWKNRVFLEEYYIFYVAIPPEEEFEHYEYDRYETTTCYYYLLLEILLY